MQEPFRNCGLGAIRGTHGLQHCVGAGVESMLHQLHQILIRFAEKFPALSFKCMQIRSQNDSKRLWHPWYT